MSRAIMSSLGIRGDTIPTYVEQLLLYQFKTLYNVTWYIFLLGLKIMDCLSDYN